MNEENKNDIDRLAKVLCEDYEAKKDIEVYKIVTFYEKKICSYFQGFRYELGKIYDEPIATEKTDEYFVKHAFHSYSMKCKIEKFLGNSIILREGKNQIEDNIIIESYPLLSDTTVCAKCIIPKGAVYDRNEVGEYISSQIKLIEILNIQ